MITDAHQSHDTNGARAPFGWAAALNILFIVVEAVAGWLGASTALLADAAHNLGDVAGLGLAWGAATLARTSRTPRRTYGLRRTTVFAALANAILLVLAVIGIGVGAARHLGTPAVASGRLMMLIGGVGVVINAGSAALLNHRHGHDLNVRGAVLHLAADASVSVAVVVGGALVLWTHAWWIDPAIALMVSAVVLVSAFSTPRASRCWTGSESATPPSNSIGWWRQRTARATADATELSE